MPTSCSGNHLAWLASLALLLLPDSGIAEEKSKPLPNKITFEDNIAPILNKSCTECHGGKSKKADLDLRRRFSILEGGDGGPGLVPGKPEDSLLLEMIISGEMPPEDKKPLTPEQIKLITSWIQAGAPIKEKKEQPLEDSEDAVEITDEDRKFWAFQPPVRPVVPQVKATHQVRTPIDAFLLKKLEAKGARFNPDASRETLIRRIYFDVLGLPPTPQAIDAFLNDKRPDAYERLVDQLLASPRYGERWGRHWLDIAGYADSDGYLAADRLRPEAWRYRDYIIRAHNDDKPFDRFVMEQIAGDELQDWRRAKEITPELADNLIATGFMRTALDPTYGNYAELPECHKVVADTMQIIGSTFLGLTIHCARCHAHKFDPISQKNYYQLRSILQASYDPQEWQVSLKRGIPFATEARQKSVITNNQLIKTRVAHLTKNITEQTSEFEKQYLARKLEDISDAALKTKVIAALRVEEKKRTPEQKNLLKAHAPGVSLSEKEIGTLFPEYLAELKNLRNAVNAENALKKSFTELRGLMDLDDKPRQTHILIRGDFNKPGKPVEPGVPSVLTPKGFQLQVSPGYKTSGRRKALARWLVDPQNPLTARVHVNRLWAHRFGKGIVTTLDNFGKSGAKPTHPELLDWLAVELHSNGYSQKAIHRLMLTSTVYRQSSQPNPKLQQVDPENTLLGSWRPHRHEGEVVRDSILAVTGKLNRQMFGNPIPVSRGSDGQVSVADTPASNRSSVYIIVRRSQPVSMLELFDTPRMEVNCTERTKSIVVTQSLTLLNSKFSENNARALADRLRKEFPDNETARINKAYRLLLGRMPNDPERKTITTFLDDVVRSELAEKFDSATPQLKQSTRQRAWNHLSLVLLNSNEFLFVP